MKLISEKEINAAVARMSTYGDDPIGSLLESMGVEQTDLCAYLVEVDKDELNQSERALLLTVVVTAWFIMTETAGAIPPKSGDFLNYLLDCNLDRYEEVIEEEKTDDDFFDEMFAGGAEQLLLMGFLANLVIDRPESYTGEIRDEHIPAIMLHIKTAVDALALDEEEWTGGEDVGEFSDEDFEEAGRIVLELYGQYEKSARFKKLNGPDRENARMIITAFGEFMYSYFLLMPALWTAQRAVEVSAEIMPRKIIAPEGFFASIYPVLISFMEFAVKKKAIPQAGRIAARLSGIAGKP